jgi:hypothetical protein
MNVNVQFQPRLSRFVLGYRSKPAVTGSNHSATGAGWTSAQGLRQPWRMPSCSRRGDVSSRRRYAGGTICWPTRDGRRMACRSTVPGITAVGMPGTLIASDVLGGQESQTALCVRMAPLAAPWLGVAVMLARQQPEDGPSMSGGQAAAPLFGRIIESLLLAPASAPQRVNSRS